MSRAIRLFGLTLTLAVNPRATRPDDSTALLAELIRVNTTAAKGGGTGWPGLSEVVTSVGGFEGSNRL
jgi:hypothetical protein